MIIQSLENLRFVVVFIWFLLIDFCCVCMVFVYKEMLFKKRW